MKKYTLTGAQNRNFKLNSKLLIQPQTSVTIKTDASKKGWRKSVKGSSPVGNGQRKRKNYTQIF